MILSKLGLYAEKFWQEIPRHFPFVELSDFVVMPNHVHGIIIINKSVETQNFASLQHTNDTPLETQNFASLQRPIKLPPDMPKSRSSKNHFGPQSKNLASIIRGYKTGVTKISRDIITGFAWQPRYHDHIIRNDSSFERIRDYIRKNPQNWKEDSLNE
jgi:putative transposase